MSQIGSFIRRYGFDVLIVTATVQAVVSTVATAEDGALPVPIWVAAVAVALVVLPLVARRRFPFAAPASVWVVATAVSMVEPALVVDTPVALIAGIIAAFLLGRLRDGSLARAGLAITVVGALVIVANDPEPSPGAFVFVPLQFTIAWFAGFALHQWAAQAEAAEERAARAEREREQAARLAVAEERARIARELHDVVAHAVSVMVLQVGAIRHRLPQSMADDRDALHDVERTGRSALTEMRRLLGAMRQEGKDVELAPQPGLDHLQALLQEVERAGLPVRLHREGGPFALPRALDLSAYRVIQEGLTNTLKHARATSADVTLKYGGDELQIEVRDDGRGTTTTDGLGHGLVGVRERVKIFGGEMSTAIADGGGFILSTRFPIREGQL